MPCAQERSRLLDPAGGLEVLTSWYRARGILGRVASLWLFRHTVFSYSPKEPWWLCVCVCGRACLHVLMHAYLCMCVCICFSLRHCRGISSWGCRGEDDEWCSALQLLLNGKSPSYRLVTGKRSPHSGMNSTCSARSKALIQWPEIPSHIRL